jgi:hypothetical protein
VATAPLQDDPRPKALEVRRAAARTLLGCVCMTTDTNIIWLVVALAALIVVLATIFGLVRRSHSRTLALRERFGPEYERTIHRFGGRAGEKELSHRVERVAEFKVRDLSDIERERFSSRWAEIQNQFVDAPRVAVARANELIKEVMRARGYSADDAFEQRVADLSVDHPDVIEHYRAARGLAQTPGDKAPNTEELRQAVVHYRVLFSDLLTPPRPDIGGGGTLRPVPV